MSCGSQPEPSPIVSEPTPQVPPLVARTTAPKEASDILKLRKQFMAAPFVFQFSSLPMTVDTRLTTYYNNRLPTATVLSDYNEKSYYCWMAVNFSWPFESNLPENIKKELASRNLLGNKRVDIFWVIQPLDSLGGNSQGAQHHLTLLKAHGWADPDAPSSFDDTRVYRTFLYGLFDSDVDLSYEVKLNEMKPFYIYTHDGKLSPATAIIKLPSAHPPSMAFWSLVIDDNNPDNNVRAVATLHWLISEADHDKFEHETFKQGEIDYRGVKANVPYAPRYPLIGQYISMLEKRSFLKASSLVKKLKALVGSSLS